MEKIGRQDVLVCNITISTYPHDAAQLIILSDTGFSQFLGILFGSVVTVDYISNMPGVVVHTLFIEMSISCVSLAVLGENAIDLFLKLAVGC
jgi:hypothetical protein